MALAAGDRAAADTHLVWAGWLFHDAVRLGRADLVVERLAALTQSVGGELVPTMAAHARAFIDDDGAALGRAASAFERLGSVLYAAEASAHAHAAHLRLGEPQLARFAAARAGILAARCQGPRTPPLADASATPLTPRELEVARFAASGLASRAIGERLRISVRTVDNHLGVIYDKLGASGRADLPTLFGTAALAPVLDESPGDGTTARVRT
jgi:DNA-binding NarL/FixJ family response regulator